MDITRGLITSLTGILFVLGALTGSTFLTALGFLIGLILCGIIMLDTLTARAKSR